MKILLQFLIILIFTLLGELVSMILPFSFPGSLIGLLLLFLALVLKIIKVEDIKDVSSFLQKNMAFLFVPLGVGILNYFDYIQMHWLSIVLILVISTTITLTLSAYIAKRGVKNE